MKGLKTWSRQSDGARDIDSTACTGESSGCARRGASEVGSWGCESDSASAQFARSDNRLRALVDVFARGFAHAFHASAAMSPRAGITRMRRSLMNAPVPQG